jgi:hypothetical protein
MGTQSASTIARDLRPQPYGRARHDKVHDPIVEPLWVGIRVLAAADADGVELLEDGVQVTDHPVIEAALSTAVTEPAILDGYVIRAALYDRSAADLARDESLSRGQIVKQMLVGERRNVRAQVEERARFEAMARSFDPDEAETFIAVDLLWLGGQSLIDVPLLERKRALEAVLRESDAVRYGAYVRPPIDSWIASWRGSGFTGVTFKAANGRYRPDGVKDDWVVSSMPTR